MTAVQLIAAVVYFGWFLWLVISGLGESHALKFYVGCCGVALGLLFISLNCDQTISPSGKSPARRQPVPECRQIVLT